MLWSLYILSPLIAFVLLRAYRLLKNYRAAQRLQLPIIILPFSLDDAVWTLVRPAFAWIKYLPFGLGSWYTYSDVSWPMTDEGRTHERLGSTFVFVTPTRNHISSRDIKVLQEIHKDPRKWYMPSPYDVMFNIFGDNVASTNGADWQRHRKITTSAFNEKSMSLVWQASVRKASESFGADRIMVQDLNELRSHINVMAMRILTIFAFGEESADAEVSSGHKLSLLTSLEYILKHLLITILFKGLKTIPTSVLPAEIRHLALCCDEFDLYMKERVQTQLQKTKGISVEAGQSPTLIESLINANEAERKETASRSYLSDTEVYGNMFVFYLAGFETTAGTFTFTLPYLAAHPSIQDWVVEEVDRYFRGASNEKSDSRAYEMIFPKLTRCLAVMYEVLRLSSPAPQMLRTPTAKTSIILESGQSLKVTPDDLISAEAYAIHVDQSWGPEAKLFNPARFVGTIEHEDGTIGEQFKIPDGANYIAWLQGPRVCPGKKFSQVEFVAVIATILSGYRIELVSQPGETDERARERTLLELGNIYFAVSSHMKKPENVKLRLAPRKNV